MLFGREDIQSREARFSQVTDYLYVTLPFQNKKGQFTTPSPIERVERAQLKRHVNERAFASVSHQKMFTGLPYELPRSGCAPGRLQRRTTEKTKGFAVLVYVLCMSRR